MLGFKNDGKLHRLHYETDNLVEDVGSLWVDLHGERKRVAPNKEVLFEETPIVIDAETITYSENELTIKGCQGRKIEHQLFLMSKSGDVFQAESNTVDIKHAQWLPHKKTFLITYTNDKSYLSETTRIFQHSDAKRGQGIFFDINDPKRPWKGVGYLEGEKIALMFNRIVREL